MEYELFDQTLLLIVPKKEENPISKKVSKIIHV